VRRTQQPGSADLFTAPTTGTWQVNSQRFEGTPWSGEDTALTTFDLGVGPNSRLELEGTFTTDTLGGFFFDYYGERDYKFAGILPDTDQVVIGHWSKQGDLKYDAVADLTFAAGPEFDFQVSMKGTTVSVAVAGSDGTMHEILGHVFNAVVVDGDFGLLSIGGQTSFDQFAMSTDDDAFLEPENPEFLNAASSQTDPAEVMSDLTYADLDPIIGAAVNRWTESSLFDEEMLSRLDDVTFLIADLAGDALALAVDDTVIIDVDAAGHGWFVDDTPYQDTEFMPQNSDEELTANEASDAYGDMDLLTVVMHELGHVYGYQDMDPETNDTEIMNKTLDEGVRYLPEDTFTNQAQDNSDSLISMDLTPDESTAGDTLNTLVNDNPWLIQYLVDGATGGTDPNGNIAVIIDDEETQNDSGDASDDTTSNPGNGNAIPAMGMEIKSKQIGFKRNS
jgi:hypothetical protein